MGVSTRVLRVRNFPLLIGLLATHLAVAPAPAQTLDLAITTGEDTVISGVSGADHEVFARQSGGGWTKTVAGLSALLPPEAAIDAISFISPSSVYFSLDADVIISATAYADEDVILWNGAALSLQWDGSANGLPAETDLDALEVTSTGPFTMFLSLDSDALLTVNSVANTAVADEDLLTFLTGSGFTAITFDGSAEGVPAEADLDAVDRPAATTFLLSFDIPGVIGALSFDDADIVQWDSGTTNFNPAPFFTASGQGVLPEVDLRGAETTNLNAGVPTATPTPTPTRTPSPTPSRTPTPTPTPTSTGTPGPTPSLTPLPSASPTPSPSPTPLDYAVPTANNVLSQLAAGHGFPATFTFQNGGNTTWTPGGGYALGVLLDPCGLASSNRITLPGGSSVPPGGSYQFSTLLTAPLTPGPCTLTVGMVQDGGVGQFGQNLDLNGLTIVAAVNNATIPSNTIPSTMNTNQSLGVGINVRNTGNTVWYDGSAYKLAVTSDGCGMLSGTRINIRTGDSVMPNTTYQFITQVTAPGAPTNCSIQFQMIEENIQLFGAVLNKNVNVITPPNATADWEVYE